MTRKIYRQIADVFLLGRRSLNRLNLEPEVLDIVTQVYIDRIVEVLTKDNQAFDPKKFRAACWENENV